MSIATITAAQRVEVRDATLQAAQLMQRYTQSGTVPRAAEVAEATPILNAAAAALVVAGASGLPATSAVVAQGAQITIKDADNSPASVFGTANVSASAITDVTLTDGATGLAREAQSCSVVYGAAADNTSVPGSHVFRVATGVVRVKLGTTVAPLSNGVKVPVGTITGSGTFFTPTIVNGVITGGVLSAS